MVDFPAPPIHLQLHKVNVQRSRVPLANATLFAALAAALVMVMSVPRDALSGPFVNVAQITRSAPVNTAHGRVSLRAEPEDGETSTSVFDGPPKQPYFNRQFGGVQYKVFRSNYSYITESGETGQWEKMWSMPAQVFKAREKSYLRAWRAKKRKLRIKHGMGQKYPNGRYIFLTKLMKSPFTVKYHGEKYAGPAPWHFSPNEIPAREKQMRALELKRRLEMEAEERKVRRLRALNVWPGKEEWRRPWDPVVEI